MERFAMQPKEGRDSGQSDLFKARLDQIVDMGHPLARLAATIDWRFLEERFGAVYSDKPGQPPLPTRLMAGLSILKHTHNLSDEELCARWVENPLYQAPVVNDFLRSVAGGLGLDQDWNSESSKKLAEPYIRSASKAAPKSLFQGRRSFHDDRTNLLWRPAKAAPRVLTVTADLRQSVIRARLCLQLCPVRGKAGFEISP